MRMPLRSSPRPAQVLAASGAALGGIGAWRHLTGPGRRLGGNIDWAPADGALVKARPLALRSLGSGGPATVLLHGMIASGRYWGRHYDALAEHGELVVPDLAGFGRSIGVRSDYSAEDHADLVAATIRAAGAGDQPVVLAAHSLGCLVALRIIDRHPDLVAGLIAFAPPLYRDEVEARRRLARAGALLWAVVRFPPVGQAVCGWMCRHHEAAEIVGRLVRPDLPAPLAADRMRHTYESYSRTLEQVVLAAAVPSWLHQSQVPIRFVVGTDDTIVDLPFLQELVTDPVALSVWPRAEHELPLTHPAECLGEIEGLRRRVLTG